MRKLVYWTVVVSFWISTVMAAVLGAAKEIKLDPHHPLPGILRATVEGLQSRSSLLTIASICVAVFAALRSNITPPWVEDAVKSVLNTMRDHAFPGLPATEHRATLFRYKWWCWRALGLPARQLPSGRWLIPFARSGSVPVKSTACFKPNHHQYNGVAGFTFANNVMPDIQNLPLITNWMDSDPTLVLYSQKTYVSAALVARNRPAVRALIGIRVDVKGVPWGVIVIDSQNPAISNSQQLILSFRLIADVLGHILERI